jgi:ABC-type polysaccharide/polyol phosphate export permease
VIARTGFYIKIEVRSLLIIVTVIALKIRDVLTYSLVLLILCVVCGLTSRFTAYKTLFALITILIVVGGVAVGGVAVGGVAVRGVVSLVGIK